MDNELKPIIRSEKLRFTSPATLALAVEALPLESRPIASKFSTDYKNQAPKKDKSKFFKKKAPDALKYDNRDGKNAAFGAKGFKLGAIVKRENNGDK